MERRRQNLTRAPWLAEPWVCRAHPCPRCRRVRAQRPQASRRDVRRREGGRAIPDMIDGTSRREVAASVASVFRSLAASEVLCRPPVSVGAVHKRFGPSAGCRSGSEARGYCDLTNFDAFEFPTTFVSGSAATLCRPGGFLRRNASDCSCILASTLVARKVGGCGGA